MSLAKLISSLLEAWSWRYDYETGSRMMRKRHGTVEYRPATKEEIERAYKDAVMQQW